MSPIPRRSLLKAAAVAGAAAQFSWALGTTKAQAAPAAEDADPDPVSLDWLEDGGLGAAPGSTVGVPWPRGTYRQDQTFALADADGNAVPVQSWPIAYWPDGSLKWTAHAVSSDAGKLTLTAGNPPRRSGGSPSTRAAAPSPSRPGSSPRRSAGAARHWSSP